jgi:Protein of unknown function (DUF1588)/Protein of unknown function (DUF1585)/Protein of unknown function (DUF1592)
MGRAYLHGWRRSLGLLAVCLLGLQCSGTALLSPPAAQTPSEPPVPGSPLPGAETPGDPQTPGGPQPGLPSSSCRPPLRRLWALSPAQLANTLGTGLPQNEKDIIEDAFTRTMVSDDPYTSRSQTQHANPTWVSQLSESSDRIASALAGSQPAVLDCVSKQDGCVSDVLPAYVRRVWRAPVEKTELDTLLQFQREQMTVNGSPAAAKLAMRRIALSPRALFRFEKGVSVGEPGSAIPLTTYELSDFVSQTLLDGPPDEQLTAAAADGSLIDPNVLEKQVRRLLSQKPVYSEVLATASGGKGESRRRVRGLLRFVQEWLDADAVSQRPLKFGANEERVRRWLSNEPILLALSQLWSDKPTLRELLLSKNTFSSNSLAVYYGLSEPSASVPSDTVRPAAAGRLGLLTQGGFLAGHPTTSTRGKWIRSRLFCEEVPLPGDVDMNLAALEEQVEAAEKRPVSPRQVRERHLADPACKGCHTLLDPLGYPLDGFDERGLPRTQWNDFPVDTVGSVPTTTGQTKTVNDAESLITALADSQLVRGCFVRQLYTFVHGRTIQPEDTCYLQRLTQNFETSGGNIRELLVDMLTGEEARFRTMEGK